MNETTLEEITIKAREEKLNRLKREMQMRLELIDLPKFRDNPIWGNLVKNEITRLRAWIEVASYQSW